MSREAARELFVAYGTTNGGDDRNAWDAVAKVADVPANTTRLTGVALPEGVRAAPVVRAPCARNMR